MPDEQGLAGAERNWDNWMAVLAAMVTGLVLGVVNGSLTALLTIPSFIVTVATMGVFRGLAYLTSNGVPISIDDDRFVDVGAGP